MNIDFFGWGISGKKITVSKYMLNIMPCLIKNFFVCGGKHVNIFPIERNTHKIGAFPSEKRLKVVLLPFCLDSSLYHPFNYKVFYILLIFITALFSQ